MKKFFTKIIWFVILLLLLSIPLDIFLSKQLSQLRRAPGENEVWNSIYGERTNVDIAIYGSSRAWVHINPEIISEATGRSTYNYGMDGHNFWLQYLRHVELLKHQSTPKVIIHSLDVFTLQKVKGLYGMDQFLPYMLWNTNMREYTSSYEGYHLWDYYIPLVRYYGKRTLLTKSLKSFIKKTPYKPYRNNGYRAMDVSWNEDFKKAKEQIKEYKIRLDSASVSLFEGYLQQCKQQKIEVVLVYTPEYIEGQGFIANRQGLIKYYDSIAHQFGIPFIDYSKDSICYNKQYFYNATHLNQTGSMLLSQKLADTLSKVIAPLE